MFYFQKIPIPELKNGRNIYFLPKCGKLIVAFPVKEIRDLGGEVREVWFLLITF